MTTAPEHPYTVEEFERFLFEAEAQGRLLELIDGEIVEKMPTEKHGELQGLLFRYIADFAYPRKLGRVTIEARHRTLHDTRNSRLPDVSFIAGIRPSVEEGSIPQMPDLAIEIKSPDDTLKELRDKAHYYLLNGTRLVWLFDPAKKLVIKLTADDEEILLESEMLDGGDVLPGFSLPVKNIFADPLADE